MKPEIKKIALKELDNFVKSKSFAEMKTIPISPIRADSYLNNPNATPNDIVLYLGFNKGQLVAFRSIFADRTQTENNSIKFGWCSGNWVHPDFRRKGFSECLLNEAYSDWNKKLMFTNYAPNSERLYIKSGLFHPIHSFSGVRAYLFPKTSKLVPALDKNRCNRFLALLMDGIIQVYTSLKLSFYKRPGYGEIKFETSENPDEECYKLLESSASSNLLLRDSTQFKWIFSYPWVTNKKNQFISKYPFSSYSDNFYYKTVKAYRNNHFLGFFIFSVREGHLKTLTFHFKENLDDEILSFIKNFSVMNKIEMITVYKNDLTARFFQRKFPFLHLKKHGQKIYSTFEIPKLRNVEFQDGDGDVFFT